MKLSSLVIVKSSCTDDSSSLQYLMARPQHNGNSKYDPFATPTLGLRRPGSVGGSVAPVDLILPGSRFKRSSVSAAVSPSECDKHQTASLMVFDRKYNKGSDRTTIDVDDGACRQNRSMGGKKPHQRLVFKNGECNVTRANIKKRRQRYMADIFTTLVDIKWRWNLLNFVLAFTLSWLIFALAWWLICFSHGDLGKERSDGKARCVEEVYDFVTALLFSIETQQTIGYGSRRTNPDCPEAILVMMCQSCFGVIIQALMTGLVFAKLSRPKKRAETLLFSKNAVVCRRDGQLCLLFRVGDMRKSHIVEAHVRAILIKRRVTQEGEVIPLYQYDLQLGCPGETEGRLFMVWPVIVEHRITDESPFWDLSADRLLQEQFELVVVLEGIVESTGMTTQARTSYLPSEILWGHRFEKLVTYQRDNNQYMIDYSRFHSTVAVDVQPYSAKELAEMREAGDDRLNESTSGDSCSFDGDDSGPEVTANDRDDSDDDDAVGSASVRSDPGSSSAVAAAAVARRKASARLAASGARCIAGLPNAGGVGGANAVRHGPGSAVVAPSRRLSFPSLMKTNGINGVALAAFDLQPEDEQSFQTMIDCQSVIAVTNATAKLTDDGDAYRFM